MFSLAQQAAVLGCVALGTGCGGAEVPRQASPTQPNEQRWYVPPSPSGLSGECSSGAAKICLRLAQNSGGLEEFLHYGELACEHGEARTCEYIGNILEQRQLAPRVGEDVEAMGNASRTFHAMGCERGSWGACRSEAERTSSAARQEPVDMTREERLCIIDSEIPACLEAARQLASKGRPLRARNAALQGCRGRLSNSPRSEWNALLGESECTTASSYGATHDQLIELGAEPLPEVSVHEMARRRLGPTQVQPPVHVRRNIEPGQQLRGVFKMCLDVQGEVSLVSRLRSTTYPDFDRRLFEAIGSWQYKPHLVNAEPTELCSSIIFIYVMPSRS